MASLLHLGSHGEPTEPLRIESEDLVTHAVCVGMTGSGKTGLCLVMLEELGRAGVPVVAVDTKGDLTNLALLFPELQAESFAPWVGTGGDEPAVVAERWRNGLAGDGLSGSDLAALRQGSPRRLFTPGSDAATSINILSGLMPPELDWANHAADLRARISTTVTALLGLIGIDAEPLTSPEHLLLSHLLERHWQLADPVTLEALIAGVQSPPFGKIGAFEVDTVMPPKERLKLALLLNNLLASPTFQAWQSGAPLAPELFLPGDDGRAPTSILYLAHLQEHERHFFLTLFLEMVSSWMRGQSGTRDLRLLIYLDEVLGYLPPHPHNPPTKTPLLTLFKQARAFGVGLALATQNPVDIDYKALTNAGTWLVGRLQTEQDRARLGETLEAAAKGAGRDDVANTIATLDKRCFLVTSPSLERAAVMKSRFAMSYLAGPLTLPQLRSLRELGLVEGGPPPAAGEPPPVTPPEPAPAVLEPEPAVAAVVEREAHLRTVTGRAVPQIYCRAVVHYTSQRPSVSHQESILLRAEWGELIQGVQPRIYLVDPAELRDGKPAGPLEAAEWLGDQRSFEQAVRVMADRIYARRRLVLYENRKLGLSSTVGESRESFEARCRAALADEAAKHHRDLDEKYETRRQALEKRLREEQRQYEQAKANASGRAVDTLLDLGGALLGGGRRRVGSTLRSVSRATQRTRSGADNVQDQLEDVQAVEAQIAELLEDQEEDQAKLDEKLTALLAETSEVEIAPRRQDVIVEEVGVLWVPEA